MSREITIEQFEETLRKGVSEFKSENATIKSLEQVLYELTEAYLHVSGDTYDIKFRVNVVSRFEYVARHLNIRIAKMSV